MFIIRTLQNFQLFYKQMKGYIRISALSDEDFDEMFKEFCSVNLDAPTLSEDGLFRWLHFKADKFILDFYTQKNRKNSSKDKEIISKKIRYLFDKLTTCYPEYFTQSTELYLDTAHETLSYSDIKKCFSSIINAGYPHQVLVFLFKNLLEEWNIERIIKDLSENTLDTVYNRFINEYALQSDIPAFLVNLYTIRLKEKLNTKLKNLLSVNDSFTIKKLNNYIDWITGWTILNFYYGKNNQHDIADWCNRIKKKAVLNLVKSI